MTGCFDRSFTIAGSGSDPGTLQPAKTDPTQGSIPTPAPGFAVGVESGDVGGGDDVDVRNTWRHGLRSTFAGV